ncbi:YmfQ family protein [Sodalis sp. dw_96]|uniref:YmfQ family protein n=1 Tax=Sodalis sp. dw_96 TaxID=2719794 RepID=UPI001BD4D597|nr:YmfQ family protein [Sodalis sp. dw_96]
MSKFTVDDYTAALQSLMPAGRVWPKNSEAIQTVVMTALASTYQQSDNAAISLLINLFPSTAVTMLPEWEKTLGLPDDCAIGETDTISKRQAAIVSKLISTGGQSVAYFISVAKALGYDITITEFRQAHAGISVCGDALNGDEWPFVWRINAETTTMTYAQCGLSYCGDPLASWGNKQLECRLSTLCPSHTIVKFGYTYFFC